MASVTDPRIELRALGKRRAKIQGDSEKLTGDIEVALRRAYGNVTVAEAAKLLGVHRTTIYRVYAPHNGTQGTAD
jgi:AcrR family transcriptional regulator